MKNYFLYCLFIIFIMNVSCWDDVDDATEVDRTASFSKLSFHSTKNQNDSVAIVIPENNGTEDTIVLSGTFSRGTIGDTVIVKFSFGGATILGGFSLNKLEPLISGTTIVVLPKEKGSYYCKIVAEDSDYSQIYKLNFSFSADDGGSGLVAGDNGDNNVITDPPSISGLGTPKTKLYISKILDENDQVLVEFIYNNQDKVEEKYRKSGPGVDTYRYQYSESGEISKVNFYHGKNSTTVYTPYDSSEIAYSANKDTVSWESLNWTNGRTRAIFNNQGRIINYLDTQYVYDDVEYNYVWENDLLVEFNFKLGLQNNFTYDYNFKGIKYASGFLPTASFTPLEALIIFHEDLNPTMFFPLPISHVIDGGAEMLYENNFSSIRSIRNQYNTIADIELEFYKIISVKVNEAGYISEFKSDNEVLKYEYRK